MKVAAAVALKFLRNFQAIYPLVVARLTERRYANAVYTLSLYQSSRLSASISCECKCSRGQSHEPHSDACSTQRRPTVHSDDRACCARLMKMSKC